MESIDWIIALVSLGAGIGCALLAVMAIIAAILHRYGR